GASGGKGSRLGRQFLAAGRLCSRWMAAFQYLHLHLGCAPDLFIEPHRSGIGEATQPAGRGKQLVRYDGIRGCTQFHTAYQPLVLRRVGGAELPEYGLLAGEADSRNRTSRHTASPRSLQCAERYELVESKSDRD